MSRVPSPEVESQNSDEQIPVKTVTTSPLILKLPEQFAKMLPFEELDAKSTFYNIQQQAKITQSAELLNSQVTRSALVVT
jgi:hypothetical protein